MKELIYYEYIGQKIVVLDTKNNSMGSMVHLML